MARIKATEVFVPGGYPAHTYVSRTAEAVEQKLRDALATPGMIVSLSGPSKSGKTVLVETVVGRDDLLVITGAGLKSPEEVWDRFLDQMGAPSEQTDTAVLKVGGAAGVEAGGKVGVPFVAEGSTSVNGAVKIEHKSSEATTTKRRGMGQVVKEVAGSAFVLLIDDFHYMRRDVQVDVAKQLKEAARLGVKICTASVPHRADDVVRANPELRGRVIAVDLKYWSSPDLKKIAELGFKRLKGKIDGRAIDRFVQESAGSPQLMQSICLFACFEIGLRDELPVEADLPISSDTQRNTLERTAAANDHRSLVDVLDAGAKTRGKERKTYKFAAGGEGDVYRCVLRAVAADPPRLSFNYQELGERIAALCQEDKPVGSSITSTCSQMQSLALSKFPDERAIDWDSQKEVLDIPQPNLLFYLRWSRRLDEAD